MKSDTILFPFILEPEYRDYVWGGARLRPEVVPTAEAWVVYEWNRIQDGLLAGQTLKEAAQTYPEELLGTRSFDKNGERFPLLIKLLDCAQWLSLQVHPDDEQAAALEGPGNYGKTEAWVFVDAEPEAQIIAGMQPGVSTTELEDAVRNGKVLDVIQYQPVHAGDFVLMPAGTIHALGPGMLVYEVQESSDWTYRVYDWDRPQTPERPLHIEKSLAVARAYASAPVTAMPVCPDGESTVLIRCPYFTLERLCVRAAHPLTGYPRGESFHALTVLSGSGRFICAGDEYPLAALETIFVPASSPAYRLEADTPMQILRASVD